MIGEGRKAPPPDINFPYFGLVYYDLPESVGITIRTTDGRSNRWPDCLKEFHSDGSINQWQPSDEVTQHSWRQKLGELLIDKFLLVDPHLSETLRPMRGRRRFLIEFPLGYRLFTQTKDGRTDHYLIGSKYVNNFRSPREFFLHACWLMKGADMDSTGSPDCECKYCDGTRTQGAIDRDFQLPGPKDSSHKSSGHHSGRHTSSAVTSEAIIMQAKDYRHLNKTSTGVQQTTSKTTETIDPVLLP